MHLLSAILALSALLLLGGCDDPTGPEWKGRIEIQPRRAELLVGSRL